MAGRIPPELLEKLASQFHSGGEQSQELIRKLHREIQAMGEQWEGDAQQRFLASYGETKKSLDLFVRQIYEMEKELKSIASSLPK